MAKYDITRTKKLKFARFGGLSSVNQKGYEAIPAGFHSPPATRGFYAFVWPYYEFFLLGGDWTNVPWKKGTKFSYLRDSDGNIINDKHPDHEKICESDSNQYWSIQTKEWGEYQKKNWPEYDDPEYTQKTDKLIEDWERENKDAPKWVYVKKPSPKIFEFDGELWSHLGDNLHPAAVRGRHGSWTKSSVEDYRIALEKTLHKMKIETMRWNYKDPRYRFFPTMKNAAKWGGKDHLEVFIEKV